MSTFCTGRGRKTQTWKGESGGYKKRTSRITSIPKPLQLLSLISAAKHTHTHTMAGSVQPPAQQLPFTGLYCEDMNTTTTSTTTTRPGAGASLVHCSVEISLDNLQTRVGLVMLFQNTTDKDFEGAIFHCRLADGAQIISFSCEVERMISRGPGRDGFAGYDPKNRLERRKFSGQTRCGEFYQCNIGRLQGGQDVVVSLRYDLFFFFLRYESSG